MVHPQLKSAAQENITTQDNSPQRLESPLKKIETTQVEEIISSPQLKKPLERKRIPKTGNREKWVKKLDELDRDFARGYFPEDHYDRVLRDLMGHTIEP